MENVPDDDALLYLFAFDDEVGKSFKEAAEKQKDRRKLRPGLMVYRISAMASTSTSAPLGRVLTATQERAGWPVKYWA